MRIRYLSSLLVALFFFLSLSAHADELANSSAWRALLHFFDEDTSEVTGGDFFLSPNGNTDPAAELQATLQEFERPTRKVGALKLDPICAFPARKAFLEKNGYHFRNVACPDFKLFIESIRPKSLTYVFSSAYPNNPASLFGHTLIRINQGQGDPLLDYGLNYAAQVPAGESGIIYVFKGLSGLYPGQLEIAPYYKKVLEYTEAESRDLWEYDLNFTQEETEFFTQHLWEVRWGAQFSYAFLKFNCSYQMMRLLQVVRPEVPIRFGSGFYVLPGDTVRTLQNQFPDWFLSIRYRPSHYKILQNRYSALDRDQRNTYERSLYRLAEISSLSDPHVLETLISFYDYEKIEQQDNTKPQTEALLRAVRVRRASLGGTTHFPEITPTENASNQPNLAHATRRVGLTQSWLTRNKPSVGLQGRLGLHDILDPDLGYETNFGITALDFEAAYSAEQKRIWIRQFNLVNILSLQPLRKIDFPLSWKVNIGWNPWVEPNHFEKNVFTATGGVGATLEVIKQGGMYLGAFLAPAFYVQEYYQIQKWFSLSAESFALIRAKQNLKLLLSYQVETPYHFPRLTHYFKAAGSIGLSKNIEWITKISAVRSSYVFNQNGFLLENSLGVFF